MWSRRTIQAGIMVLALALSSGAAWARGGRGHRLLPRHVVLGIANGPGEYDWLRQSRVPVGMRYQYLAGGANTGRGWATWERNGAFATTYVRDSRRVGAIPVFTYYMMLDSQPSRGSREGERVSSNLNNPDTMRAYYQDFRLLMQRASAAGGPVIVHVEPDMFGFLQADFGGRGAAQIPAAVSSTGIGELQGLPNTAQGFGRALLRLRNRHGRGVLLGIHASHWSGGADVGSSRDARINGRQVGLNTARFLRGFGEGWNLVFVDPSDRDSGWKDRHRPGGAHWWDTSNRTYPNFERYRQFIDGVSTGMGLRVVVWQVPIGNTLYRSVNNTENHYQDNRPQYFLESRQNIARWAQAGVVAILFGAGAGGNTHYHDAARDGVTNPPPINNNNRMATYADDDGGYLRLGITRYYRQGPVAIP